MSKPINTNVLISGLSLLAAVLVMAGMPTAGLSSGTSQTTSSVDKVLNSYSTSSSTGSSSGGTSGVDLSVLDEEYDDVDLDASGAGAGSGSGAASGAKSGKINCALQVNEGRSVELDRCVKRVTAEKYEIAKKACASLGGTLGCKCKRSSPIKVGWTCP